MEYKDHLIRQLLDEECIDTEKSRGPAGVKRPYTVEYIRYFSSDTMYYAATGLSVMMSDHMRLDDVEEIIPADTTMIPMAIALQQYQREQYGRKIDVCHPDDYYFCEASILLVGDLNAQCHCSDAIERAQNMSTKLLGIFTLFDTQERLNDGPTARGHFAMNGDIPVEAVFDYADFIDYVERHPDCSFAKEDRLRKLYGYQEHRCYVKP